MAKPAPKHEKGGLNLMPCTDAVPVLHGTVVTILVCNCELL
jgi:hypothetical protein